MYQVGVAFKILQDGEHIPVGYKKAIGHLIFDINMDFNKKAWWVKNIHFIPDLEDSMYAEVVYRESVRISIAYADLHPTQVLGVNVRNAYL